jgi:Lrp/AsnC family leucine-responsive transcriptional regulator
MTGGSERRAKTTGDEKQLDGFDRRILSLLQADARISNKEIAQKINLSPTPCLRRIKLLEEAGFIDRYKAILDPQSLGYSIHAFLSLKRRRDSSREDVSRRILDIPEVISCHVVSGEYDLMVELVARDMEDYARITINHIAEMPGIYDLRSTFSIKALKRDGDLPIAGGVSKTRGRKVQAAKKKTPPE